MNTLPVYKNRLPLANRLARSAWNLTWLCLFRPSPAFLFGWRRLLLRLFGARLGRGVHVYPSVKIWAPWNLSMGDHSGIGPDADCYNVDRITLGPHVTVSQYAFLCTAGHDVNDPAMPLITAPIEIQESAWIAADAFVGMGVTVRQGAVVGARASVFKDVSAWTIVGGNPAKTIGKRRLKGTRP